MKIKSRFKNIWVGVVNNGCAHSGLRTLNLALPQKGITGINWFLVLIKILESQVTLIIFDGDDKNGHGL